MKKVLFQFSILVILFFSAWFALSQINFTGHFDFKKINKSTEHKLGNAFIEFLNKTNRKVESDTVINTVNLIKKRICEKNEINADSIKVHIFYNNEINAFALPDNNIVIYSNLITDCKSAEELGSVMAHEIAHIEKNHIMKKLSKDVGISVLLTIAGGQTGSEIIKEALRMVSSTAFDRELETEADSTAVRYLAKVNIDPENLANFLFRLSNSNTDMPKNLEWISTHPNSKDRVSEILKLRKLNMTKPIPLFNDSVWVYVKDEVK